MKNMYIRDIKLWKKNIAEMEELRDKMTDDIALEKKELKEACHHPQQYVKTKSDYFPGGYLNTSYTDHTPYCELCEEEGETKTVNHGNYS